MLPSTATCTLPASDNTSLPGIKWWAMLSEYVSISSKLSDTVSRACHFGFLLPSEDSRQIDPMTFKFEQLVSFRTVVAAAAAAFTSLYDWDTSEVIQV